MKEQRKGFENSNLQEFIDSAANALKEGQQQFFTPPALARTLFLPIANGAKRGSVFDPHIGAGALAASPGAKRIFGLDIDGRVEKELKDAFPGCQPDLLTADFTRWYGLARRRGISFPCVAMNPPFSLQWHSERLAGLAESSVPELREAFTTLGPLVDSTIASFMLGLDLLHPYGEGFMICNAATARRFFGPPEQVGGGPFQALKRYLWLWVEIGGASFEGLQQQFTTAVLYFSKSHGRSGSLPRFVESVSPDPQLLATRLNPYTPSGWNCPHLGTRIQYEHEVPDNTATAFVQIGDEYRRQFRGAKPPWNIRLDDAGIFRTQLTPFQQHDRQLDRKLVERLHQLAGETPAGLCVTATSRTALREAMQSGVWRIHANVAPAVERAMAEHAVEGAPFYPPNEVQALGWIDEHSKLKCSVTGLMGFTEGVEYELHSKIENLAWEGSRVNLMHEEEALQYHGRELVIILHEPVSGASHHFHVEHGRVNPDKPKVEPRTVTGAGGTIKEYHWPVIRLVEHFEIPRPADIVTLRRDDYLANLARLDQLTERINTHQVMLAHSRES